MYARKESTTCSNILLLKLLKSATSYKIPQSTLVPPNLCVDFFPDQSVLGV